MDDLAYNFSTLEKNSRKRNTFANTKGLHLERHRWIITTMKTVGTVYDVHQTRYYLASKESVYFNKSMQ